MADSPHTIGVEFGTRIVDVQGKKIKLQIWDTGTYLPYPIYIYRYLSIYTYLPPTTNHFTLSITPFILTEQINSEFIDIEIRSIIWICMYIYMQLDKSDSGERSYNQLLAIDPILT